MNQYQQYNQQYSRGNSYGGQQRGKGGNSQRPRDPMKAGGKLGRYVPKQYDPQKANSYPAYRGIVSLSPELINALLQQGVSPQYGTYPLAVSLWYDQESDAWKLQGQMIQPSQQQQQAPPQQYQPPQQQQYAPPHQANLPQAPAPVQPNYNDIPF